MKKLGLLLTFGCLALLFGCPVGLDFPAEVMGKNPIDKRLIGTWQTDKSDLEFKQVKVGDNGNNTYAVEVLERGSMFALETDNFLGWVTRIGDYDILILQPDNEAKYYHYVFRVDDKGNMVLADVSLLVGGVDAVTSTEALRTEILESSKLPDFIKYENTFTKK